MSIKSPLTFSCDVFYSKLSEISLTIHETLSFVFHKLDKMEVNVNVMS